MGGSCRKCDGFERQTAAHALTLRDETERLPERGAGKFERLSRCAGSETSGGGRIRPVSKNKGRTVAVGDYCRDTWDALNAERKLPRVKDAQDNEISLPWRTQPHTPPRSRNRAMAKLRWPSGATNTPRCSRIYTRTAPPSKLPG